MKNRENFGMRITEHNPNINEGNRGIRREHSHSRSRILQEAFKELPKRTLNISPSSRLRLSSFAKTETS